MFGWELLAVIPRALENFKRARLPDEPARIGGEYA